MSRVSTFFVLSLLATAAVVACAESNDDPVTPAPEDGGTTPPLDAGEAPTDAAADADADADTRPPPDTCTADGWCLVPLPAAKSSGLESFRVVGIVADGAGSAWAVTNSNVRGAGERTSHLLRYEQGAWVTKFGVGPLQSEPFPYTLRRIAGNGSGSFIAVGGKQWAFPPEPVIVRVENGTVSVERPEDLRTFVSVVFTSATEVWALDDEGRLYRSEIGGSGPLAWTREDQPHDFDPNKIQASATTVFRATDGALLVGGRIEGTWGENGFVPGKVYLDRRTNNGDGTASWTSTILHDQEAVVTGGVEVAPSVSWLVANDLLLGSPATGPDGGIKWATPSQRYPDGIWGRAPNDVWAVAAVGRIYHYDGSKWADSALALNGVPLTVNALYAIDGLPSGELWVAGEDIAIHRVPKVNP